MFVNANINFAIIRPNLNKRVENLLLHMWLYTDLYLPQTRSKFAYMSIFTNEHIFFPFDNTNKKKTTHMYMCIKSFFEQTLNIWYGITCTYI